MNLYWNDPDPIKGNDYKIQTLTYVTEDIYLITYNNGHSQAEVYGHELEIR